VKTVGWDPEGENEKARRSRKNNHSGKGPADGGQTPGSRTGSRNVSGTETKRLKEHCVRIQNRQKKKFEGIHFAGHEGRADRWGPKGSGKSNCACFEEEEVHHPPRKEEKKESLGNLSTTGRRGGLKSKEPPGAGVKPTRRKKGC